MSRFQSTFEACRSAGRAALMPYVTAGDPKLEWTEKLVDELVAGGADMIELGVPYSDPLADGPTIQAAGQRALQSGTTVQGVLDLVGRLRSRHDNPIALLVYYNCIYRWGEERFVRAATTAGVDGLIIPDLPPEEAVGLEREARSRGINLIYLLAPTSTPERIRIVAERASGFIYCVSVTGVTGARQRLSERLAPFLKRVRDGLQAANNRNTPLAVGFGISSPEQVHEVGQIADGAIVGSALIDRFHGAPSPEEGVRACGDLVRAMVGTLVGEGGSALQSKA